MGTTTTKRIVCLANSRKLSGRCIAGKEILENGSPGGWVRPVSSRPTEEVSEDERQYMDGTDPRVLDVINVPLMKAQPKDYQTENWLLDPRNYWTKLGKLEVNELYGYIDPAQELWTNGNSTFNGLNDQIPLSMASSMLRR